VHVVKRIRDTISGVPILVPASTGAASWLLGKNFGRGNTLDQQDDADFLNSHAEDRLCCLTLLNLQDLILRRLC